MPSHPSIDLCEVAATKAAKTLGCSELKPEQMQVVTTVLRGRDVLAVLPTGYGKTYATQSTSPAPAAFDALLPGSSPSIVIVLSPLTAIMKDQAVFTTNLYKIALHDESARLCDVTD